MESNPPNHQKMAKFSPEQFQTHQVLSLDPKRLENDLRMAVAHTDSNYAPKQVQISLSIWIPEPLHMTLTNHNWILVISQKSRGQIGLSDLHGLFIGDSLQIANT